MGFGAFGACLGLALVIEALAAAKARRLCMTGKGLMSTGSDSRIWHMSQIDSGMPDMLCTSLQTFHVQGNVGGCFFLFLLFSCVRLCIHKLMMHICIYIYINK